VTFGGGTKDKVLGTDIIKVNDYFTIWLMLIWMFSFISLVHKFLILLASLFVAFLTSEKSFKQISHLLNLL
jgi:hypothetical protein